MSEPKILFKIVDKDGVVKWTSMSEIQIEEKIGEKGDAGKDGIDGKDGARGEQGIAGIDGKDGVEGKAGKDGKDGRDGRDGIEGKDGKDGESAYDIWLSLGHTGTKQDFIDYLRQPRDIRNDLFLNDVLVSEMEARFNEDSTLAVNGKVYTTQNHNGKEYVRNENLWCNDIVSEMPCISPWNNYYRNRIAGTLITPQHVLTAEHYRYRNGDVVRFVDVDGNIEDRTVIGWARDPEYTSYRPDFRVHVLNEPLPTDRFKPCKVMPENWGEYLKFDKDNRPPALLLDQEEKALVGNVYSDGRFLYPTDEVQKRFSEALISGDSGNPSFFIVDGELVLITVWTYGGSGSGTPISQYHEQVNQMIKDADAQAKIDTGHTITPADFSAYKKVE